MIFFARLTGLSSARAKEKFIIFLSYSGALQLCLAKGGPSKHYFSLTSFHLFPTIIKTITGLELGQLALPFLPISVIVSWRLIVQQNNPPFKYNGGVVSIAGWRPYKYINVSLAEQAQVCSILPVAERCLNNLVYYLTEFMLLAGQEGIFYILGCLSLLKLTFFFQRIL